MFEEALIPATLDFEEITRARADLPLLADLEMRAAAPARARCTGRRGRGRRTAKKARSSGANDAATAPAVRAASPRAAMRRSPGATGDPLAIDPALTRRWLVEFMRDEVVRRRGFKKVVVGLSGGVDSSLTAFLAAEALGTENVIGVRMPYRTSSPESLAHAQLVIDALGIRRSRWTSAPRWTGSSGDRRATPTPAPPRQRDGAERMIALFDLSAKHRALPLGTGNKSERLLRLLHLARRRFAAGEPARRPLQDPGLGAGPPRRRAGGDRRQARERRPRPRARPTRATSASPTSRPTPILYY